MPRLLEEELDSLAARTSFSGVVRVDREQRIEAAAAYGLADRGWGIPNELQTQFALASGTKGLTALAVVSLIEEGALELATKARSLLGPDLPLVEDAVTVEHLLSHRSGIGDYLDEDVRTDVDAYVLRVPAHELATTEDYLAVLDGHATKFSPGDRFSYSNGGYVVLALLAERATGSRFADLVRSRVCEPAGMGRTAFHRSDELVGQVARGYIEVEGGWRTNVFHLPVIGSGDGGCYSTASDVRALWTAFFEGRIVSSEWVAEMTRPRSETSTGALRYGLGFWLRPTRDVVMLEGMDAGVSFRSLHDPHANLTCTVISNTSGGAWPVVAFLEERLGLS